MKLVSTIGDYDLLILSNLNEMICHIPIGCVDTSQSSTTQKQRLTCPSLEGGAQARLHALL